MLHQEYKLPGVISGIKNQETVVLEAAIHEVRGKKQLITVPWT